MKLLRPNNPLKYTTKRPVKKPVQDSVARQQAAKQAIKEYSNILRKLREEALR